MSAVWHSNTWRRAVLASKLRPPARLTAVVLAEHAGSGETAWATIDRLVEETSHGRTAVRSALKELLSNGWVVLESAARQHQAPVYRLVIIEDRNLSDPSRGSAPDTLDPARVSAPDPLASNPESPRVSSGDPRVSPGDPRVSSGDPIEKREKRTTTQPSVGPPTTDAAPSEPDVLVGDVVDEPPHEPLAKEPTLTQPRNDQTPALIEAEPKPPPAARRRRIPDDWAPSPEHAEMAAELGLDIGWEAAEFRDYWLGCGRPMLDWSATFRSSLRRASQRRGPMRQRPEPASDRRVRQGADRDQRLAAEEEAAVAALFAPPLPLTGPQP